MLVFSCCLICLFFLLSFEVFLLLSTARYGNSKYFLFCLIKTFTLFADRSFSHAKKRDIELGGSTERDDDERVSKRDCPKIVAAILVSCFCSN